MFLLDGGYCIICPCCNNGRRGTCVAELPFTCLFFLPMSLILFWEYIFHAENDPDDAEDDGWWWWWGCLMVAIVLLSDSSALKRGQLMSPRRRQHSRTRVLYASKRGPEDNENIKSNFPLASSTFRYSPTSWGLLAKWTAAKSGNVPMSLMYVLGT